MGLDAEHGEVVGIDDRPLTGVEKQRLERGHDIHVGNGSRPGFDELTPQTLREYQRRAVESRRLNTQARKLMEQAAYLEAHKEHAATILGGRLAIIEGLLEEMVNPETKKPDTRLLGEKRLQMLQTALNDFDKGMGLTAKASDKSATLDVNVTHTVSKILDRLGE